MAGGDKDVSLTMTDALLSTTVTVRVSLPSVRLSFAIGTVIVARPLDATVVEPLNMPPTTSEAETPVMV